jgi:5-methylcytosine-specific restriction protein B
VILYGPPGTGKTFIARQVVEAMVDPQLRQAPSEAVNLQHAIEGLPFYDVLALSMYLEGSRKAFSVPEIEQQKIVQAKFAFTQVKHPKNSIWGYLQAHTDPESKTVKTAKRFVPYLFDKDQASRWILTEIGREYVTENLVESLNRLQDNQGKQTKLEDYIEWVTFHQSFAYEDFVEGLRPVVSEDDPSIISYEIIPGAFRRICTRAANDHDNQYFLVIDEINRGNIAKILGELITLLEDDKRSNLRVRLPYSGDLFTVPNNLCVIGTMNTADRSIALLDVALRRRFAFVEITPRPDLLNGISVETEGTEVQLDAVMRRLNEEITRHIDRDHQIGHSYFLQIANEDLEKRIERLDFAWNHQILPLLEEYFYSQRDKLAEILTDFSTSVEVEAEGQDTQTLVVGHIFGTDLVYALSKWIGAE